jgi:hypothetical protein
MFHVSRAGEIIGELEYGAIRNALIDGRLTIDDWVWQQGYAEWKPILEVFPTTDLTAEEQAMQWARQQSRDEPCLIPDRRPGEEPATKKQLDYIRQLVISIDEASIRDLGKWQASSLIEQIIRAKAAFTAEKMPEMREKFFAEDEYASTIRAPETFRRRCGLGDI